MKTEKVSFNAEGKRFCVRARKCSISSFGLIFRTRKTFPCIFRFDKPSDFKISSLFVFFPFVAIWLDAKGNVLEARRVNPFTVAISSKKKYCTLLEIPINSKYIRMITSLLSSLRR